MNAYTRQDLSVMQAWPLERKIRVTQAKIIEWYHRSYRNMAIPSFPRTWHGAFAMQSVAARGRCAI